ncbi:MAG: BlaI/MecI/CopY family transcriptional regulator [Oscillospiraceae bacterium]|nr:BlaI/MecI/CopY family transcriptional regulator [Oscillospiraceae bacterium]
MRLTRSELEVMETLWLAGRPLPRNEIIELSTDRSWSPRTIHILLNGLLQKGAIKEAGFVKRTKTYGRLYAAKISGEDYYANSIFSEKNAKALPMYFSALMKSKALTVDMVSEMEQVLLQRKQELLEDVETETAGE